MDERAGVKRFVTEAAVHIGAHAERPLGMQRHELHRDQVHALEVVIAAEGFTENTRSRVDVGAARRGENCVAGIVSQRGRQTGDARLTLERRQARRASRRVNFTCVLASA